MGDPNGPATRSHRRSVLKATGSALAALTTVMAAGSVAATDSPIVHDSSIHRRMARLSTENVCDELDNSLCDYVDTIEEYAGDPASDPNHCPGWYPDEVCRFLDTVVQVRDHNKNTRHAVDEVGTADEEASSEAAEAKRRVDGGDYVEAAIKTGRALHFVQDAGTLVHAGREVEQLDDYGIHSEYEQWIADTWDENFDDAADTAARKDVESSSDVESWIWTLADRAHDDLEDRWHDIEDPGEYDEDTVVAQRDRIRDAATISNGTIYWIWENA